MPGPELQGESRRTTPWGRLALWASACGSTENCYGSLVTRVPSTFGEMLDTPPEARRRYYDLIRRMSVEERARACAEASYAIRQLAEAGIRSAHPGSTEDEVRARLTARLYGREVALRLHGWAPPESA